MEFSIHPQFPADRSVRIMQGVCQPRGRAAMSGRVRWLLATGIALAIIAVPALYYRIIYSTEKRFREVTPGKFYRCGQLSADAFRKNLREYRIKTVINLQDEYPDPKLSAGYWDNPHIHESQVCAEEGARFLFLAWA